MPLRPERHVLLACNLRVFRIARRDEIPRGIALAFGDEEGVGGDAERGVVVKAAPAPAFVMSDANLLFDIHNNCDRSPSKKSARSISDAKPSSFAGGWRASIRLDPPLAPAIR